MKPLFLVGRFIFGGFFLYNGINHFLKQREFAQYAGAKHVPKPDVAVQVSGALLAIGGISFLLGLKPKVGAAAIVGFLATASPMMHNFWAQQDPQARQIDMINFAKNFALLGAALSFASIEEPWPASVPIAQPTMLDRAKKTAWKVLAA
jgi:uncharacterized membrane protein YphA (DoxX/SURF4 family)